MPRLSMGGYSYTPAVHPKRLHVESHKVDKRVCIPCVECTELRRAAQLTAVQLHKYQEAMELLRVQLIREGTATAQATDWISSMELRLVSQEEIHSILIS